MQKCIGPVESINGFPIWLADERGTVVELALSTNDPTLPGVELADPGAEVVFPENFPDEDFYSLAETEMTVDVSGRTTRARLIIALEAAFGGTGEVKPGQQMVFGRVRFRLDGATPGDVYSATHPHGRISTWSDEDGKVDVTEDIGSVAKFASALDSTPWPFLRSADAPAGYLGDGATATTLADMPNAVFAIDGPGVLRVHDSGGTDLS